MTNTTNRQLVEDWMDALGAVGIRSAFERYASNDYKEHHAGARDGQEGAIAYLEAEMARGSRDHVQRTLADGDMVLMHMRMAYADGSPDKSVIGMWRVDDGKLAEHWEVMREVPAECVSPMF